MLGILWSVSRRQSDSVPDFERVVSVSILRRSAPRWTVGEG